MNYRIDIWTWGFIADTYWNNNVESVLKWFKDNWVGKYENGLCTFHVYKDDVELSFEEEYRLGFYS